MKNNYNESQLKIGTDIEMEHTKSRKVAKSIARDHLRENKDYYKYSKNKGKEFLVATGSNFCNK